MSFEMCRFKSCYPHTSKYGAFRDISESLDFCLWELWGNYRHKNYIKILQNQRIYFSIVKSYLGKLDCNLDESDLTEGEISEFLMYMQIERSDSNLKILKSIKSYLSFFFILTIIGLIGYALFLLQMA